MVNRETLKRRYNLALAVMLGVGFALGYTLRDPNVTGALLLARPVRDIEQDFAGCARTNEQLLGLFAQGDSVRADYAALLERVEQACAQEPDYVPFAALRAAIWEDWMVNLARGRYGPKQAAALARQVGLADRATSAQLAEACRARAVEAWRAVEASPLVARPETYGDRWRVLLEQHLNALRRTQVVRVPVAEDGMADLARAFNVFALTRDFVRYPNDLHAGPEGFSFEEKHIQDTLRCPQHADVTFALPCLPYLAPSRGGTLRRELALYRTGLRVAGQKLDLDPRQATRIHLLAFNTTAARRVVRARARLLYADRTEEAKAFDVPPWRQDEAMMRDVMARRALDPVHRDSETHLANGSELNFPWSPFYMYHIEIEADPRKRLDEIYFPSHDAMTPGLEDAGIDEVCIVAMTIR